MILSFLLALFLMSLSLSLSLSSSLSRSCWKRKRKFLVEAAKLESRGLKATTATTTTAPSLTTTTSTPMATVVVVDDAAAVAGPTCVETLFYLTDHRHHLHSPTWRRSKRNSFLLQLCVGRWDRVSKVSRASCLVLFPHLFFCSSLFFIAATARSKKRSYSVTFTSLPLWIN